MSSAGTALYVALWPYVADLTVPGPAAPNIETATYADVAAIYGTGSEARTAMANALGIHERRARQSFLEAARRWEKGAVRSPNRYRGQWAKLVEVGRQEVRKRRRASRRTQLDTLSSMIADRGLLIRRLDANVRVSGDERDRSIRPGSNDHDDDGEEPSVAQGIWLSPDLLEEGRYGLKNENVFDALAGDDWETAATCVFSLFMDEYTEGATGGYATFVDEVEELDIEIP